MKKRLARMLSQIPFASLARVLAEHGAIKTMSAHLRSLDESCQRGSDETGAEDMINSNLDM